ncbi:aromatase/cyclase [Streptomyces sp. NPDC057702]|uniref:aromatase/cyclase n=1 Tax=unclassified Streptomyces TaxID=2593676 RepID=UPI003684246E
MTESITTPPVRFAEHSTTLRAPVERAYALVADVTRWPLLFAPCVDARVIDSHPGGERIRLWALAGGGVRSWTSRRELAEDSLRVGFRTEHSAPPIASMAGYWQLEPPALAGGPARLVLGHEWTATDSSPETQRWIAEAVDRNSEAEIASVRDWSERARTPAELVFSFTDRMSVNGPPAAVYAYLHRADLWPERLPHVERLELTSEPASETTAGAEVQTIEMDTRTRGRSTHTTRSVRLCFAGERITYKQTAVPRPLLAHCGEWRVSAVPGGTEVTARHSVVLDPLAVADHFGPDVTLVEARRRVRAALGGNSLRTLERARQHVEDGVSAA